MLLYNRNKKGGKEKMNIPAIILIIWFVLEIGCIIGRYGKTEKVKNPIWAKIISWAFFLILLLWSIGWTLQ